MSDEDIDFEIEDYKKFEKKADTIENTIDRTKLKALKKIAFDTPIDEKLTSPGFSKKPIYPQTKARRRILGYVNSEPD